MKQFDWNKDRSQELTGEIISFMNDLIKQIDSLEERLNNFNKDEEIQKLKKENINLTLNSLHIMSDKEKEDAKEFSRNHFDSCESNIEYILTRTGIGIGTGVMVRCKKCDTSKDITDYTDW